MKSFIFVAAMLAAVPASAATYQFDATSVAPSEFSNFSLTFNDTNNNGLFDLGELVSFSGITTNAGSPSSTFYSSVVGSGNGPLSVGASRWSFSDGLSNRRVGSADFSYSISAVSAVPVPASLGLLGGAMVLMGGIAARRRRKS